MRLNVEASRDEVTAFCERWQVTQLAIFGSALREDFGPESDVDLLVSFEESARHTLFDMVRMENELKAIFGREVDLVSRRTPERIRPWVSSSSAGSVFRRPTRTRLSSCGCVIFSSDEHHMVTSEYALQESVSGGAPFLELL